MQNTQEINWWLEFFRIGIPSSVALVVPFIAGLLLARKMKEFENSLSTDLKTYEGVLNRRLEEYKSQLNEKNAKVRLYIDKLDELHGLISQFRFICTNYVRDVLIMSNNGYVIEDYKKLSDTTLLPIPEMDSKIGLYAKEAEKEFGELVIIAFKFKQKCSQYLLKKEDSYDELQNSLETVLESCNKILKIIEKKSFEYRSYAVEKIFDKTKE